MVQRFDASARFAGGAQYVGGRAVHGGSGRSQAVVDPATGEPLYRCELAGSPDVDAAVRAAEQALPEWAGATPAERSDAMHRRAAVLRERTEDFVHVESLQCGKPLKLSEEFDVPGAFGNVAVFAGRHDSCRGWRRPSTAATTPRTCAGSRCRSRRSRCAGPASGSPRGRRPVRTPGAAGGTCG